MVNIVAEIGCNHMGDPKTAMRMSDVAFACGVNYVKFQKRSPSECLTPEQYSKPYSGDNSFGITYGKHRERLEILINDWYDITHETELDYDKGMFATVFDFTSLKECIECLDMPIIKIGSAQINRFELLGAVVASGKKIILSTGMSTIEEIDNAFEIIKNNEPVLMQCTSVYPCPEDQVNLNVIPMLKKRYGCEVGLSGHYVSGSGAIEAAAVALGATWIERHFTLDRTWKGTDQAASLEPEGLKSVVKAIRTAEQALGSSEKKVLEIEEPVRMKHRGC